MSNKDKNQNVSIEAVAEMWAKLILMQLQENKKHSVEIVLNENKNNYE